MVNQKVQTPKVSVRHKRILKKKKREYPGKNAIITMARRAGVVQISAESVKLVRQFTRILLKDLLKDASIVSDYMKKKTVQMKHVEYALQTRGMQVYGS